MRNQDRHQYEKARILRELHQVRSEMIAAAQSLSPNQRGEIFLGTWSIEDVLAHLIGWDHANIEAAEAVQAGRLPEFYAYRDKDWQSYNARLVNQYKTKDWDTFISSILTSHHHLVYYFDHLPVESFFMDWGVRYKGYKVIISRLLEAEIKDERIHLEQVWSFFGQPTGS